MRELSDKVKLIKADVLVIGGGVAGLFAAIKARDVVDRVVLVDKGPLGFTSQAYFSGGFIQALLPNDNLDAWVEEVVYFQDGLCEQDTVEMIYRLSYDRIKELESYGVTFKKSYYGNYARVPTRGLVNVRSLVVQPLGLGGQVIIRSLVNEARRKGIWLLSRVFILDLLKQNSMISGAFGVDVVSGNNYVFQCPSVVLATGQCSFKGHYPCQDFSTGEGIMMAYKAGAELKNLEFVTIWMQPAKFGWAGAGIALPLGARFVNARGETFMERYSPSLRDMIDFNYIARACAIEARKGNGPFYLDHTTMKTENLSFISDRFGWMQRHIAKLVEKGIHPYKEKVEWMPAFWGVSAVRSDLEGRTCVPGLFIAGRIRSLDPGVNMTGWSLISSIVLGHKAGIAAGIYAKKAKRIQVNPDDIDKLRDEFNRPLEGGDFSPDEVLLEIQRTIFPSEVVILKHEKRLKQALTRIELLRTRKMYASNIHELMKAWEVKGMLLIAEMILRASIMRTESRASHYREDYPERNEKWLKWIILKEEDGKIQIHTEQLPLERYKFKPTRFYMDNFRIPLYM